MSIKDTPKKEDKSRKALGLFRRGLALVALAGSIVFAGGGWLLESWMIRQDQKAVAQILGWYAGALFLIGVLTNLTAACVIYWTLSEKIFKDLKALESEEDRDSLADTVAGAVKDTFHSTKDELSLALAGAIQTTLDHWKESRVEEFSLLNQPPWDDWIKAARMIEICVQGWEDWVVKHSGAWDQFFMRGGAVKLFLPNPEDPETLRIVGQRLPDRGHDEIRLEIKNTYRHLREARNRVGNGTIIHHQLHTMNWYCAVRFDEQILLLSPYEHLRIQQSRNPSPDPNPEPHVKSPSYKVPLQEAAHSHTSKWIKKEFEGLARREYSAVIQHPAAGWDYEPEVAQ